MSKKSSKFRLCFIVDSPYAGGAEQYISRLARGLDDDIFDKVILAKEGNGLDEWCRELESVGIGVHRVPMNMPFSPFDAIPVFRKLFQLQPRIVHINLPGPYDGQMGLVAPLARLAGCCNVVATEHLPRVERLWKRAIVKNVSYQWVDKVLTICTSNIEYLVRRQGVTPEKIEVIYNGVPTEVGGNRDVLRPVVRRRLELDGKTLGLVYVGSLIERKGLGLLLNALEGVNVNNWRLFVVGTGEDEPQYKRDVEEKGFGSKVRFLGSLDETQIEEILCAMDLLVLPSFMEGMPYVILEAMACSLPVVSTRIDGIPEAAPDGEAGLLVEPGDVAALRVAVERLLTDKTLRHDLGAKARQRFAEMFTLEIHIARMEAFYLGLGRGRS